MYRHCRVSGTVTCITTVELQYRDMYHHCGVTGTVACVVTVGLQVP